MIASSLLYTCLTWWVQYCTTLWKTRHMYAWLMDHLFLSIKKWWWKIKLCSCEMNCLCCMYLLSPHALRQLSQCSVVCTQRLSLQVSCSVLHHSVKSDAVCSVFGSVYRTDIFHLGTIVQFYRKNHQEDVNRAKLSLVIPIQTIPHNYIGHLYKLPHITCPVQKQLWWATLTLRALTQQEGCL